MELYKDVECYKVRYNKPPILDFTFSNLDLAQGWLRGVAHYKDGMIAFDENGKACSPRFDKQVVLNCRFIDIE